MTDPTGAPPPPPANGCVKVPANPGNPTAVRTTPVESAYQLDVCDTMVERLTIDGTPRIRFLQPGTPVTNQKHRPRWIYNGPLKSYSGPGSAVQGDSPAGKGAQQIQELIQVPLTNMMAAMRAEGQRIQDDGMMTAWIGSGHRDVVEDGQLYLKELHSKIAEDAATHKTPTYPATFSDEVAKMAASNLRTDAAYNAFVASLANDTANGWNAALADQLITSTNQHKAAGGRSPHESGLVVDIQFNYVANVFAKDKATDKMVPVIDPATGKQKVLWKPHNISRNNNPEARLSAAGMWLELFAPKFHFSSYDTTKEIWHYEFLLWEGKDNPPDTNVPATLMQGAAT